MKRHTYTYIRQPENMGIDEISFRYPATSMVPEQSPLVVISKWNNDTRRIMVHRRYSMFEGFGIFHSKSSR